MIIAVSGTDGAGKSTQIARLQSALAAQGIAQKYIWARGGYTPLMLRIKGIALRLLGRKGGAHTLQAKGASDYKNKRQAMLNRPLVARVWLALAIMDLALLYGIYLRVLVWRGKVVLCDRYLGDTKIDFLRNFPAHFNPEGMLWRALVWLAPTPSVHFLLTVPYEVSELRSAQKNEPFPDSQETLEFRLSAYRTAPEFTRPEMVRLDGTAPVDDIAGEIQGRVTAQKNLVFGR